MNEAGLDVRFWGVRGSVGVSGAATAMFGGYTSCIEITAGQRRLILDAGTGIVPLGMQIKAKPGDHFDILLSHLHHDHVIGLMLFAPCFVAGVTIDIYCGNLGGDSGEDALKRLFSPPLFPLTFGDLPAKLRFIGFSAGETLTVGGVSVQTCPLNHPNGATGYRFNRDGKTAVVLTDMEHEGDAADPSATLTAFCQDADLVVYDATFDEDDYPRYRGWGHSTWEAGAALAKAAKAKALACFHHAPEYDDARLMRMEAKLKADFAPGFFAREGQSLTFRP
jgi:phosphoribosyl 1,2-cyclic phosphodiesterase